MYNKKNYITTVANRICIMSPVSIVRRGARMYKVSIVRRGARMYKVSIVRRGARMYKVSIVSTANGVTAKLSSVNSSFSTTIRHQN